MENDRKQTQNSTTGPDAWYGSKTSSTSDGGDRRSEDAYMTFQSKEPIISIPLQDKATKHGSGGGGHGLSVEHPTSYIETLMHLFKGNVGSGVFAMGDAVKNAGIIFGPIVTLLLGIICVHCQHLLLTASKKVVEITGQTKLPDFAETVELCFENGPAPLKKLAPISKKIVNLFLCITQLGFCCVYFVFIASNMEQLLKFYGYELDLHYHMAIILPPILLTCWVRNLKYLAPLSTIANICMMVGMIITVYFTTQDLPPIQERKYIASINTIPLFFGTALYAFEGIGLVLPLQNEMKEPKQFQRPLGVLNVGMFIVTILYILMGFMGYFRYGDEVMGSLTLNLPEDSILGQSVKIIIPVGILLTYALQFYIPVEILWPSISKSIGPFKYPVVAEIIFRTLLVLLTFVLAEAIPYLNLFISLVGAVSSTALALLIPPLLELVTRSSVSELNAWIVIKNAFIFILGLLGCVTGTYESISAIVHTFQQSSALNKTILQD